MSLKILGLRTTIYKVADLEKAKSWYTDAFGPKPYFDEPFYVGFNIAGYELGLMPDETPADEKTGTVLTYWGVEDVEKAVAHFEALGATVVEKPTNVGGEIVVAGVADPWGNVVGLIYNPEFKLP
ncbi:VOC family protein [Nitratireductor sp. XY-223]|uniref:VOC family protein n=1 Tax=Nitratireductor sp. XY-223 TaxID=2561926 RepID=UPI0010AA3A64|nr:VOC family protein [Nitratireductor sp. XY-223]